MKGRVTRTIDIRVIIVYDTRPSPAGARGPIYSLTTTRRVRSPAITTPRSCPLLDTMSISGRIEYGLVLPLLPHLDLGDLLSWQPDLDLSSPYPCLEIGLCFRRRAMDDTPIPEVEDRLVPGTLDTRASEGALSEWGPSMGADRADRVDTLTLSVEENLVAFELDTPRLALH